MSSTPKKLIHDCSTGESTYADLTPTEIADLAVKEAEAIAQAEANAAARASEEATRESARAKLAALGLTEAEVAALVK